MWGSVKGMLNDGGIITRNSCIAEPCAARVSPIKCQKWKGEIIAVNCVAGEGGFQHSSESNIGR